MDIKIFFPAILCGFVLWGCSAAGDGDFATIEVDADQYREIDVTSSHVIETIPLEAGDAGQIRRLSGFALVADTLYVLGDGRLLRYNRAGLFIDEPGAGSGEMFRDFEVAEDSLYLLTRDGARIYSYSLSSPGEGDLVPLPQGIAFSDIIKADDREGFFAAGISPEPWLVAPMLYSTDENLDLIEGSAVRESFANPLPEVFYSSDEGTLYWRMLCDTIYSVDSSLGMRPEWVVDFGDRKLPEEVDTGRDTYNRMIYLDMLNNREKYATLINNVRENDSYVAFIYLYGQGKQFVARYNKSSRESEQFFLVDSSREESIRISYLSLLGEDLFVATVRPGVNGNNPVILRVRP
jgi:hypothetical protein